MYEIEFDPPIDEPDYTDAGEYAWHLADLLGNRGDRHYTQAWGGRTGGVHISKSDTVYIHGPHHGIDGHLYVNGPVTIEVQVSRATAEKIMAVLAEEWQPDMTNVRHCEMRIVNGTKRRHCKEPFNHEGPHRWGKEY